VTRGPRRHAASSVGQKQKRDARHKRRRHGVYLKISRCISRHTAREITAVVNRCRQLNTGPMLYNAGLAVALTLLPLACSLQATPFGRSLGAGAVRAGTRGARERD